MLELGRKAAWQQFAAEVGGEFRERAGPGNVPFGHAGVPFVQACVAGWTVTFVPYGTRIRAHALFFNPEGLRFEIYQAGLLSDLGKTLGQQDIEVGHARFDRDFVIKGNAPGRVRRLFANERIRRLISAQPQIRLSVGALAWHLDGVPKGIDRLALTTKRTIKALAQLRELFDLCAEILQELCHDGGGLGDEVGMHIRHLMTPWARTRSGVVLWDNREARRGAADALGRLGDPAAVPALASVLEDEDTVLRAVAVDALMRIGESSAIGSLVPWLSDARTADGRPMRDRAADALRQLGESDLVEAVLAALRGEFRALKACRGGYRSQIVEALVGALGGPFRHSRPSRTSRSAAAAASALGEINATKALPDLRRVLRAVGSASAVGTAVSGAIKKLEAEASLPRAASASDVVPDTLPRSAGEEKAGLRM